MKEQKRRGKAAGGGAVVWLTGLPGAGKSTIARQLARLSRKRGAPVEVLDGDELRRLFPGTGFSARERDMHVRRVGYTASLLERNGVFVVVALVSPYRRSRRAARRLCRRFVEVHVSTPAAVCEERDPKGHYARARSGRLKNFTGVDDPYEAPRAPELSIDASKTAGPRAARRIWDFVAGFRGGAQDGRPS